ncbi:Hypothetical predicted protein [Lecanosticta acicola]|uniref:Uncharacterized protein n=1 Tax=Lecanosticta acicola TaxID=111012 RepID=A0AAI8Z8F3_9PEZI|nr:Hypothetical predicted protein [Lecanosticta acicola]
MAEIRACDAKKVIRHAISGEVIHNSVFSYRIDSDATSSDWHYTVPYPREYVEYLEEQQEQLSTGLLTLYRLLKESNIKTVPPLPEKPQAQDLLTALRGLKLDPRSQSHGHRLSMHAQSQFSSAANNATGVSKNRLNLQLPSQSLHGQPEASSSGSPTLASMYGPCLPSTQDLSPSAASRIPTSAPGSFVPGAFGSFDYSRYTQPPAFLPHRHSFPTGYPAATGSGSPTSGGLASVPASTSWHHPTSAWSPVASVDMGSPTTTVIRTPQSPPGDSRARGGEHESSNKDNGYRQQQQHQHQHQHPSQQHAWAATWAGEMRGGVGVGMFANMMGGGDEYDSGLGLEAESIEQRGRIVLPHDTHAL